MDDDLNCRQQFSEELVGGGSVSKTREYIVKFSWRAGQDQAEVFAATDQPVLPSNDHSRHLATIRPFFDIFITVYIVR